MIKNILKILVCCTVVIVSSYAWAGVVHIPITIKCSPNSMAAPWVTFNGVPGIQYTIPLLLEDYGIGK